MAEMSDPRADAPASFARLVPSADGFRELFREGMGLVEAAASYLDGPGRDDLRTLARTGALAYASESMRLTTRLMQVASWLLLQRAVQEGEITVAQAAREKAKVRLDDRAPAEHVLRELPAALGAMIERSVRLQERVRHLDATLYGDATERGGRNPIADQLDRIESALAERFRSG